MDVLEQRRKEQQLFRKYLEGRRILIADPSSTARIGILKIVQDLGGQVQLIQMVNTFPEAKESIEKWMPHVVITEFTLGKQSGLDLLMNQREQRPKETKECLFVIVTGNTSQSAVARAAEEEIDGYIIKPFTPDVVRSVLIKAALDKIRPSDYSMALTEGKDHLAQGRLDEAEASFEKAKTLDRSPSLACYYLAQIKLMRKVLDDAQGHYTKGLSYNRIHYKCLVGLFDLLMQRNQPLPAYEVVKKISQYFPANPKRLTEVLRLAIVTSNYDDIEKYYLVFTSIDERNEEMLRYVSAALVVCGKHYLSNRLSHGRAFELFQKAVITSQYRAGVLKEIILSLVESKVIRQAETFLAKFTPESQKSPDYLLCDFMIKDLVGSDSRVFDLGRDLISRGVVHDRLYQIMLKRAAEAGITMVVETVLQESIKNFPKRKEEFEELVKNHTKKKK